MKRAAGNSKQSQPADEETWMKFRHESLLQDYLERQKEFVSKKKKLQAAKQKRDILLAETRLRFLRQRHSHMLKIKSAETEPEARHQNSDVQPKKLAKKRRKDANEAVLNRPSHVSLEEEGTHCFGARKSREEA